MADQEHSTIAEAHRHEPKGITTADAGDVYTATGGGTDGGTWQAPPSLESGSEYIGAVPMADGAGSTDYAQLVWKDLVGHPMAKVGGGGGLTLSSFRGGACEAIRMGTGDDINFTFHMPHDYAVGTDMFLHVHWAHNGTAISGDMDWLYSCLYAKGHNQQIFSAEVQGTISYATTDITTTPQYMHRIDEIQLSASTPSVAQIDTDDLEVDGLLLVNIEADVIPSITGGSGEPFILTCDLHYQANAIGTVNKVPNFYE